MFTRIAGSLSVKQSIWRRRSVDGVTEEGIALAPTHPCCKLLTNLTVVVTVAFTQRTEPYRLVRDRSRISFLNSK
jgi:hypothetical protein